jgi:uncharacterized protein YndB with AHSA1/START domain
LAALVVGLGFLYVTGRVEAAQDAPAEILTEDRLFRLELRVPVEREEVYAAWTDANRLVEWLPHWAEMTVAEGDTYVMGWDGYDGEWRGVYLEVDEPEVLAFTWQSPDQVMPDGSYPTVVRLTFEEEGEGTLLVLEHFGFRTADDAELYLDHWKPYLYVLRAFLLSSGSHDS